MLPRPISDRCPGVLRPFSADDGAIVRLRIPGGRTTPDVLTGLTDLSRRHGAPFVQLTSRANLQLRGLSDPLPQDLVDGISDLGLLPSPTHERVRNIVADGDVELDSLVRELDDRLCAEPKLADLPGRWLFAVAGPAGRVLESPYDAAYQRFSADSGVVLSGGYRMNVHPTRAVDALIESALAFLRERRDESVWNVRDLSLNSRYFQRFYDSSLQRPSPDSRSPASAVPKDSAAMPGRTTAELGIPLGFLTPVMTQALVDVSAPRVVVTPRRSVLVTTPVSVEARPALLDAGFVDATDDVMRVSACIGAPFCRRTTARTLDLARELMGRNDSTPGGRRVHVVGCARACGHPGGSHDLLRADAAAAPGSDTPESASQDRPARTP